MAECAHMMCDQKSKAKGLCAVHYGRMHYASSAIKTPLDELCNAGLNRECVQCGLEPFGGGMRCLACFQKRAMTNRGDHVADVPPSNSTYSAGCRCRDCKLASAEYQRQRRRAKA